ncbi:C39 family peptidase [Solicola sp. PLA-1-18]|uniref:C39 family peptidase n=1 Tax=Solicola sp. PLA-1-18 TaxID=3380532 RepID=UPI003B81ACC5
MRITPVTRVTAVAVATALSGALLALVPAGAQAAAGPVGTTRWVTNAQLAQGSVAGTRVSGGSIKHAKKVGKATVAGKTYTWSRWTSPWASTGFAATEVIPSWNAKTPKGSLVQVQVRVRTTGGRTGSWDTVADWASADTVVKRRSGTAQTDDVARVVADTVRATGSNTIGAWQVRLKLMRRAGAKAATVQSVGATFSAARGVPATSRTTMTRTTRLAVPQYSQMIHLGEYPKWNGGGEAWCSPTSTTMVLRYYSSGPTAKQYAWVNKKYRDRFVDHGARQTYDYRYGGTGNWSFNTAYAGSFGHDAHVARLRDLRDAEALIKAGTPVIVSIEFSRGQLSGAPISSTAGHVVVITGFTADGKVLVNDPAGATNGAVQRTYDRAQFERAWIGGSNGTAYVIKR